MIWPMSEFELSEIEQEILNRATRLLECKKDFHHKEFILMQHFSIQVYSKKLCRVVFMFYKKAKTLRVLDYVPYKVMENQNELKRLLERMRRIMVLEDMADV